jgi:acyl-CoA thioesterase-2
MDVTLSDLLACLDLAAIDADTSEAPNLDIGYHRIFGGQLLAQIVGAASAAVPGKAVKSLTVQFPREGDADRPVRFRCTVHHQGRTFATVAVVAFQAPDDRIIGVALVSLHAAEHGLHHSAAPPEVGGPHDAPAQVLDLLPWEVRVVGGVDLADRAAGPATFTWWMRADSLEAHRRREPPTETPGEVSGGALDQALLAFASDLTLIGTALRPIEGLSQADSTVSIATAVTSHSLWFHQPFRADDWLLVVQEAPALTGARAFGRGDVFSGTQLVASFAQESMVRELPPSPH